MGMNWGEREEGLDGCSVSVPEGGNSGTADTYPESENES